MVSALPILLLTVISLAVGATDTEAANTIFPGKTSENNKNKHKIPEIDFFIASTPSNIKKQIFF
jgi:hypothetical protein